VYDQSTGTFRVHRGPTFAILVLADEMNRAPPNVLSVRLEAMEAGQVTIDGTTHPLPHPFLVLATQNPIEEERKVLRCVALPGRGRGHGVSEPVASAEAIVEARRELEAVRVEQRVQDYVEDLAMALPVLRHRIRMTDEADVKCVTPDHVVGATPRDGSSALTCG